MRKSKQMTLDDLMVHERMKVYEFDGTWYAILSDDQADREWEGTGICPSEAVHWAIFEYRKAWGSKGREV